MVIICEVFCARRRNCGVRYVVWGTEEASNFDPALSLVSKEEENHTPCAKMGDDGRSPEQRRH
jgi:hypothetical protein